MKLACHPNPCSSCPYARTTPSGIWHPSEYAKLPAWDNPMAMPGTFLCHTDKAAVCRGWMEVHHDNLSVRMAQIASIAMPKNYKPTSVPLYASGLEAAIAGMRGVAKPSIKAKAVIHRIIRKRQKNSTQQP